MKLLFFYALVSILLPNWQFRKDHEYSKKDGWTEVRVPHDWAILGPFDRSIDLQVTAITQNGEAEAVEHTARSGGLPWIGKGCYRTTVDIPDTAGRNFCLYFDGAMSNARVLVNGQEAGEWPYGYNAFHFDISGLVRNGDNEVIVLLENLESSSRWYPGAGLYREVRLIDRPAVHVPVWGTRVTTPYVSSGKATITVSTEIEGLEKGSVVTLETVILDGEGKEVARSTDTRRLYLPDPVTQHLTVNNPSLWCPESPALYTAVTKILDGASIDTEWEVAKWRNRVSVTRGDRVLDSVATRFGIRSLEYRPLEGFFLNGRHTMFKGVCNHHDLGALGAAVNRSAIRHRLTLLKNMGCNAIRTSHNMPSQALVELCDEMGFMLMVEPFDEWDEAKCENGYHRLFDQWAEKDLVNMIRHFRNNPSVVMWSIGNEVPSQWSDHGVEVCRSLQEICHREDPTRPVTSGMDQPDGGIAYGMSSVLDIPGFNYKVDRYTQLFPLLPQGFILGTETASTVSSRGIYHFPVRKAMSECSEDHQCSSYDLDCCTWSNIPDEDFAADIDYPWLLGQFVWTGFDYLGEPTPYDTDAWPNHSSMFGILDLATLPKDRYFLYRSMWNESEQTLHILPHWTWPGREGEITPVYVYTSYPSAELFVNGESRGRRSFNAEPSTGRFRLVWDDVVYQSGELKVIAYDKDGNKAEERTVHTAGSPKYLQISADKKCLEGIDDLVYLTVTVYDGDGNPVPDADNLINIKVSGSGSFKAVANGDPTCLESFQKPHMHLFSGSLCFIVEGGATDGPVNIEVSSKGLVTAKIIISNKI